MQHEVFEHLVLVGRQLHFTLAHVDFAGRLDPLIGRNDEIQRIMHILARRRKNNALIVGDSGVARHDNGLAGDQVAGHRDPGSVEFPQDHRHPAGRIGAASPSSTPGSCG